MTKTITLKYAGTCQNCGQRLTAGSRAHWHGRGKVSCLSCSEPAHTTSDGQKPKVSYFTTSGGTFASCNCEDYPCCGH